MRPRGTEQSGVWRGEHAVLAVARHAWETAPAFSGPVAVLREGDHVVAADASLYYRDDLRRRLDVRGVRAGGDTPSHLILAAYRAWGERCAEMLEGDFAFILWDERTRRTVCARDLTGKRALYFAELGGTLIVASTIAAVLAHPECSEELDVVALASNAAGFFADDRETSFRTVSTLPAGRTMVKDGREPRIVSHWQFPSIDTGAAPGFETAAEELRELLSRAVAERLAPNGTTSIWLSGGYDSTAVFGAGQRVLRQQGSGRSLLPVSISYPRGDPGREDELIASVAAFWRTPVHWLDIDQIPFFDRPVERAAAADMPTMHPFQMWLRALMRGSRAVDSRVALDGHGGDQLFAVSMIYLADLFARGQWSRLRREWRAWGSRGYRAFFDDVVEPALPLLLREAVSAMRSVPASPEHLWPPMPAWMNQRFVGRHGLVERQRRLMPRRRRDTRASRELYFSLVYPGVHRVTAESFGYALEEGVEFRSPLVDRRLIEFAAPRPQSERASGHEVKYLLRRAVRGLVPDEILAPRALRTGMVLGYFDRSTRERYADVFTDAFADPVLGELGIVDAPVLQRCWSEYLNREGRSQGLSFFNTLQVELWLRARLRPAHPAREWGGNRREWSGFAVAK